MNHISARRTAMLMGTVVAVIAAACGGETDIDATIDRILNLQLRFEDTVAASDNYVRTSSAARVARQQLAEMERILADRESALNGYFDKHPSSARQACAVKSLECTADVRPTNLAPHLMVAAAAGLFAFATTALISRRPDAVVRASG